MDPSLQSIPCSSHLAVDAPVVAEIGRWLARAPQLKILSSVCSQLHPQHDFAALRSQSSGPDSADSAHRHGRTTQLAPSTRFLQHAACDRNAANMHH